ncbi:MAG: hypothetical protein K6A33_10765 [Clostridiales bacterium]|nr:hypothetical protein [Clostridiales bacterium]
MKHERRRAALNIAVQFCLIVFTVIPLSALLFFVERPDEPVHFEVFRYFTTLSNVAAALAAIPAAVFAVRVLSGKGGRLPLWLLICRFLATSMLTLTMMTVLCFLGPIYGYGEMYTGVNFWFHLINPVLSVTAFLFLETETAIPFKAAPLGIVPTVLYGLVYVREVVFIGAWPDFYSLNPGGRWVVSVLAMLFADLLLSALLLLARGKPPEESEKTV